LFQIAVFYNLGVLVKHPPTMWWLGGIMYICLRFSECLNPIFYNLASRYYNFTKQIFKNRQSLGALRLQRS